MAKTSLVWENKGGSVWVSKPIQVNLNPGHTDRTHSVIFRIDGRNQARESYRGGPEGFRVDRASVIAWEAIDGGKGPATQKEARQLAQAYLDEIVKQCTLTPRV